MNSSDINSIIDNLIIGWCIAPNASAFMWIMQQLGGGQ